MNRALIIASHALLFGCSPGFETLQADLEVLEVGPDTQTLLVAARRGAQVASITAVDYASGEGASDLPRFEDLDSAPPITIFVAAYDQAHSDLGISELGNLAVDPSGGTIPLGPTELFERPSASTDTSRESWTRPSGVPDWVDSDVRSDAFEPCDEIAARIMPLGTDDTLGAFVEVDDAVIAFGRSRLAFRDDGQLEAIHPSQSIYRITRDGHTQIDEQVPNFHSTFAERFVLDAEIGSRGRVWLTAALPGSSQLYVGSLESGFEIVAPRVVSSMATGPLPNDSAEWWIRWIHVVPGEAGDTVYTHSDNGTIQRFDEASERWTVVHRGDSAADLCNPVGGIHPNDYCGGLYAYGAAIFAHSGNGDGRVLRIEADGTVRSEQIPQAPSDGAVLTFASTRVGLLAIRAIPTQTVVYRRDDESSQWDLLYELSDQRPFTMVPHRQGAIYMGQYGYARQLGPTRACPAKDGLLGIQRPAHSFRTDDFIIVTHGYRGNAVVNPLGPDAEWVESSYVLLSLP